MSHSFEHLLSPIVIRGHVLKNRMISSSCLPHFLQGPEIFPSESIISFVENIARAGSALVTIPDRFNNTRHMPMEDIKRGPCWDPTDPSVDNYLSAMVEAVHFQGSLISAQLSKFQSIPHDVGVYEHMGVYRPQMMLDLDDPGPGVPVSEGPFAPAPIKAMNREQMDAVIDEISSRCAYYKSVGFDAVCLHFAYNYNVLACFLSSETNRRTDEYGGSVANRARFPLEIVDAIRKTCGEGFIIELQVSGDCMPEDEFIEFARLCEGRADILQLRLNDMDNSHATSYNYNGSDIPPTLKFAEAAKKAGVKILTAPNGGFHDPEMNERFIAEGKTDLISAARPFICDGDYGRKIIEERTDTILPCLHCNKCHEHVHGSFISSCAVNPEVGLAHRLDRMIEPAHGGRKIAVIGAGPAGMRAALLLAERGNSVTLYEKSAVPGGQLTHADYPEFKWALREYKDRLIYLIGMNDRIKLLLNTEATPEMIAAEGFDAVVTAVGAKAKIPAISGIDSTRVYTPLEVYGREHELGRRVVVIGGSETGTETGMYLAEAGHEVTVLTRNAHLAENAWCVHAYALLRRRWLSENGFTGITGAVTTSVADGVVRYSDAAGDHEIECDSIVVSGGVEPLTGEALAFSSCARYFFNIGDSNTPGNVRSCNRMALAAAAKL